VSLRLAGTTDLNPKTEIKNVNSIENLRAAIEAEIDRQRRELDRGGRIEAWTLEWDEDGGSLRKMRSKETEADYRYFREPDLLPLHLDPAWRASILATMPELPLARRARFVDQYHLPPYDAEILTEARDLSDYFEQTVSTYGGEAKAVSNWLMNDVLRLLRERGLSASRLRLTPGDLAAIIRMVEARQITTSTGKELLGQVEETGRRPQEIVEAQGLAQVSDAAELEAMARAVLAENPDQVSAYRAGKATLIGWFVGQVMRRSGGKADPQKTRAVLEALLVDAGS
jgi:aspartyl-tRNA(Asn)/glutamyl-tRNA(Gln) amidotransferase subunit B